MYLPMCYSYSKNPLRGVVYFIQIGSYCSPPHIPKKDLYSVKGAAIWPYVMNPRCPHSTKTKTMKDTGAVITTTHKQQPTNEPLVCLTACIYQ